MRQIIFSDLDGTLLDHDTYSFQPALAALERLRDLHVPVILVTSKTRAETEFWRKQMRNHHPFIVENGGAAFIPHGYFSSPVAGAKTRDDYEVLEWGTPYSSLVQALKLASERSGCLVRGFASMSREEIAQACSLDLHQAAMAAGREYDEPFEVLDSSRTEALTKAIAAQNLRVTRGGRFWHITGANDKGIAVQALTRLFEVPGEPLRSIGLGDGLNDVPMLLATGAPVLIRSAQSAAMQQKIPHGLLTAQTGPSGWNEAISKLIPAV